MGLAIHEVWAVQDIYPDVRPPEVEVAASRRIRRSLLTTMTVRIEPQIASTPLGFAVYVAWGGPSAQNANSCVGERSVACHNDEWTTVP